MREKTHNRRGLLKGLLFLLAAALVLAAFLNALGGLNAGRGEEGRERLEDAVRRAAVACYAAEGIYPPDLDYLEEHYGLQIDEAHYTVHYDVFASNLMPDITVLEASS